MIFSRIILIESSLKKTINFLELTCVGDQPRNYKKCTYKNHVLLSLAKIQSLHLLIRISFHIFPHWLQLGIYSNETFPALELCYDSCAQQIIFYTSKEDDFIFNLYFIMWPLR